MTYKGMDTLVSLLVLAFGCTLAVGQIVDTQYGKVQGHLVTLDDGTRVNSFYGLPFAKQPVGELRFAKTQEPDPWDDVFVAEELPPACAQGGGLLAMTHPLWDYFSEACLSVNVFAPNDTSNGPYPVMVWFHGGGYGGSANIQYPGHFLVRKGVIVVVPNYRLGALGFLTTEDESAWGNWGMWDQVRALEYVRDNIAAFGGDPNKVTLFGQSAGGSSSGLHMVSDRSKGLFHQAILQSGSELALWGILQPGQQPVTYTQHVADKFNCTTDNNEEMVECLRTIDYDVLRRNQGFPCTPGYFCQGFAPVVDGDFLMDEPLALRNRGEYNKDIKMMAGQCENDGSLYTLGLIPESGEGGFNRSAWLNILENRLLTIFSPLFPDRAEDVFEANKFYYTPWPYLHNEDYNREAFNEMITDVGFGFTGDKQIKSHSNTTDSWYFIMGLRSANASGLYPEWMGVPHNGELPYVWGYPLLKSNFEVREDAGIFFDVVDWTDQDSEWADYVQTLWTNFAKYGNPTPEPVTPPEGNDPTDWKQFTNEEQNYLYINYETEERVNYNQKNHAFWTEFMTYMTGIEFSEKARASTKKGKPALYSNEIWDNIEKFLRSRIDVEAIRRYANYQNQDDEN